MIIAAKAATGTQAGLDYRWVAVGDGGSLATSDSTTLASWTSRTSSFGSTVIQAVASNGSNLYVAVGQSGKLATSPDAITWTQQTSSFGTTDIYGVAFGNGLWVAVGGAGKIATSTDGTTWTQRTSGETLYFAAVGYGNGLFVAGGQSRCRTSTDGITWTSRTSTLTDFGDVFYNKTLGIWTIGFDSGTTTGSLASSTDGTTWTARNTNNSYAAADGSSITGNDSVTVIAGVLSTLGVGIESSTNGTTWTSRTAANAATYAAASDNLGTLAFINGNLSQTSSNGTTWTARTSPGLSAGAQGLCHSSGTPSIR